MDACNIRPLQQATLDIFKVFSSICERHNFRYYAYYGTCLGAIRHNGFIPWDDDFDVAMPRKDFDKFREVAQRELPDYLGYVDWRNTKEFAPVIFAKIQDKRKSVVERLEKEVGASLPQGVFMDIFPLDGIKKGWYNYYCWKMRWLLLHAADSSFSGILKEKKATSILGRLLGLVLRKTIFQSKDRGELACFFERLSKANDFSYGSDCGCLIGPYGTFHGLCEYGAFDGVKKVNFEDTTIFVPKDYDTCLRKMYGNYMKLPPEDKRICTHNACDAVPWKYGPTSNS